MKTIIVTIRPDRLNFATETACVGKLSSAVFDIGGDIPDDVDGLTVLIGRTDNPTTHTPREDISVVADAHGSGFRCYLAPFCFPDASDALKYHLLALDASGNPRWLGTGSLRVLDNPADGSPIVPPIIPSDTYIRNPATGLYHKLTATLDEDGNLALDLADEGVER